MVQKTAAIADTLWTREQGALKKEAKSFSKKKMARIPTKLPEELICEIYNLAGPLTKWLNGRMKLNPMRNKRLIRRDAVLLGWKGDYSHLFECNPGDESELNDAVSDTLYNESSEFYAWLFVQLQHDNQTVAVADALAYLDWDGDWKVKIENCAEEDVEKHFMNAVEYSHVEMLRFFITNNACRAKFLKDKPDSYFIDKFFVAVDSFNSGGMDPWIQSAQSTMLWIILRNASLEGQNVAMDAAVKIGDLEMVKWLHSNVPNCCTVEAMNIAAYDCHLEILKFLHENRTEGCTSNAMDYAAINGHLEVVKWLHENRTEGCTTYAMDLAAQYGFLEMLVWLHENRTEGCTTDAMDWAAEHGHLHIVKWIWRHYPEHCNLSTALDLACRCDNTDVMDWLAQQFVIMENNMGSFVGDIND